ncbi:sigma-E factor regulatory protein RseB [Rosenbergiella australiborealis]|uniref:Sigma-E factor regulatory protein RseB n=1 Tax=Rosenbergiella australiborealis TaxID=1544696 RepID=A0ABS5T9P7_9GAMM|nr:sigma-E factor regulatory protein RseB [Rosenbergiella australiborealis]MBT0728162.1 sigma-E factor regulatory protein RseB [Rosenbergiella australiborealis]
MKGKRLYSAVLCGSLLSSFSLFAQESPNPIVAKPISPFVMLQQMDKAVNTLNYQLSYINITEQGIESLRYRHALVDQHVYAQLLQMDGPRREVIQRSNAISYFDASSGVDPFTLPGDHIIDGLPAILFADFDRLKNYYNFISVGRSRVADRLCDVVRIVSKDGSRFSYAVWLDSDSGLPLRADLLSQEGETIEQFQVVDFAVDDQLQQVMSPLVNAKLPPEITSLPKGSNAKLSWTPGWLPAGVMLLSQSQRHVPALAKNIESRLYSDGLFTFTVNVSPASETTSPQSYSTGRRTLYVEIRNNKEISVVGELPRDTAKRIADTVNTGD